jgi:hypothetical protein
VTQLEISSTEIRELVAAGRDPRFLLPDAVRAVIEESGCYAPADGETERRTQSEDDDIGNEAIRLKSN